MRPVAEVRVWVAGEGDAGSVAALMGAFRDHIGRGQPTDDEIRRTVDTLLSDTDTEFLLAAPDGADAPAGVCQLRYRLSVWTSSDDCWLEDLFVSDEARGTGLGRALIAEAFDRARARGCGRVQLDVAEDNERAIEVYRQAGFGTEPGAPGRTMLITRRLAG
jgi:ribosomal protein S18 acetylase RimI-like enzyme